MLALSLSLFASFFLFAAILLSALRRPGYSHIRHTISELGEVGSADGRFVSLGVFGVVGLALAGVALLTRKSAPDVSQLAVCLAVGYVVAALFPCDPGSPLQGSARQSIHNLGGGVEYLGGTLALWKLSELQGIGFQVAAVVVGLATLGISVRALFPIRGLVQRVAEVVLFSALVWSVVG